MKSSSRAASGRLVPCVMARVLRPGRPPRAVIPGIIRRARRLPYDDFAAAGRGRQFRRCGPGGADYNCGLLFLLTAEPIHGTDAGTIAGRTAGRTEYPVAVRGRLARPATPDAELRPGRHARRRPRRREPTLRDLERPGAGRRLGARSAPRGAG